jgi:predicted transcriptional regulator
MACIKKVKPRTKIKTSVLTDIQNACLEAAQESTMRCVSTSDVVWYVDSLVASGETATIARCITKAQASRALQSLHAMGVLKREPRASAGWGQGWWPSVYRWEGA